MFASYDNENYLTAFTLGGVGFGFDVHRTYPGYNWTGFYVGAMGGYGWSESQCRGFHRRHQ